MPPVKPMLAKAVHEVPHDAGLLFEPKWDGFRCIVFRDGDEIELGSRNDRPLTRYFPELVDLLKGALPAALRGRRRDRGGHRGRPRLRRAPAAPPPGRVTRAHARREDAGQLRRLRPPRPRRPRPHRRAVLRATPAAREGARRRPRPGAPHADDRRPGRGRGLVRALRGRRLRRRDGQAGRPALPAGQARDDQGEARAHRRLRRRRVPLAQGRQRRRLAAPRPLRRRRQPPPRRRGQQLHRGAAQGARRRAGAAPRATPSRTTRGASGPTTRPRRRPTARCPAASAGGTPARTSSWEPLRAELVAEVRYEHVLSGRFRHGGRLVRFRPDRTPDSCTYAQLDEVAPAELADIFL